jgi:putative heme-binding domain-containing protein
MIRGVAIFLFMTTGAFAQSLDEKDIPDKNPYQSDADLARGKQLFLGHCAPCHGPAGDGGKGANLARPILPRGADDRALFLVVRKGIPGTEMPGAWEMNDHEIWQVAAFVRTLGRVAQEEPVTGDRTRGEELVRSKGNCLQCHTVGREGGRMAPPLTDVGYRRNAAFLRQTLLDPKTTIPEDFLYVELVTKNKKRISGIRINEDTYSIQVRDLSDRLHSYYKSELAEVQRDRKRTPMPSYQGKFSDSEMGDVVAYLLSLRGLP